MHFPKVVAAQRLQSWLLLAALVSLVLIGLLVVDLTRTLRTAVISDTQRSLVNAARELALAGARTNLEAASYETLRSYPEIEGGYINGDGIMGHTFPTHTEPGSLLKQPELEYREVRAARDEAERTKRTAFRVAHDGRDLVLIAAAPTPSAGTTAWCLRRIFNFSDSSELNNRLVLVAVMLVALSCIGIVLRLSFSMQRGFALIQSGLDRLRTDASFRLPEQDHELSSIVRDVNAMAEGRQALETDLRREDRLRVMGRVVAGIAHEIRNPLNSIRLTIRVLERRLNGDSVTAEPIQLITGEIDRLDSLLKSLLVFRTDSAGKIRQQPLQLIIDRTLALVKPHAEEQGVEIRIQEAPECLAFVDGDYLQQALMNLLLNAVDASGKGGAVSLSMQRNNGHVELAVEDSGPGLSADQKERIFEAFYTTKTSGTGLGLAVTKTLLEKMGARIEYGDDRTGACFRVSLPTEQVA